MALMIVAGILIGWNLKQHPYRNDDAPFEEDNFG
jgi:hypothetical protein